MAFVHHLHSDWKFVVLVLAGREVGLHDLCESALSEKLLTQRELFRTKLHIRWDGEMHGALGEHWAAAAVGALRRRF